MKNKHEIIKRNGNREVSVWDPFRELYGLRSSVSRLFDDVFHGLERQDWEPDFSAKSQWMPSVNVEETEKEYLLTAALPGMEKKDINVEIKNNVLTVSGERKSDKEEKGKNFLRREHSYGSFRRVLSLPDDIKAAEVKANYKDGLLSLRIPKAEGAKPRSVKVSIE